jgi:hypothetical protein
MNPELVLGNSIIVFAGLTVLCMGSCAALIGMKLARQWQPARNVVPYALALGLIDRLLGHTLFSGDLLSAPGFAIDTYVILMTALLAYHRVLGRLLVRQYPWMYQHFLFFGWRSVPAGAAGVSPPQ